MYSFDNRPDTVGMDEPFYAYYLAHTGKQHPGRQDVLDEMPSDPALVLEQIHEASKKYDHVFIKNMGHHMLDLPLLQFNNFSHVILIRNPKRIIASLTKVLDNLELLDIAVAEQWKYYNKLKSLGSKVVVVDSTEILKNPEFVLRNLCQQLGIKFMDEMISWKAGSRPIDGSWAPYYYAGTHRSTGFGAYEEKDVKLSSNDYDLYEKALVYYKQLVEVCIHKN